MRIGGVLIDSLGAEMGLAKGRTTKKDVRVDRRRDLITERIVTERSLVQCAVGGDRKGEMAMKNFLSSSKVTTDYLIAPHAQLTAAAAQGRRVIAAQDTTEVNFSGRDKRRKGLGPAGDGETPGFFAHVVLAVDADDEAVIGPVSAQIWTREEGRTPDPRTRAFEDKESARWLEGARSAAEVLAGAAQIIVVGDRENDIYEVFARKPDRVDLVIRAAQNRALADGGLLFDASRLWPALGGHMVEVAPKGVGDKGRTAIVLIKAGSVTIRKPGRSGAKQDPETLTLNMVEAYEVNTPAGVEPLMWRILTTLPVSTLEEASEVVRIYRLRWRIEQLYRTLKTDGLDLEATQLVQAKSIMNLAALGIIASCRIMQLVDARDGGERLATDVIREEQIEDVAKISATLQGATDRQKNTWPKGSLPWLSWVVARLGGWNCYYKKPGPKRMARGWRRLEAMLEGMAISRQTLQLA